MFFDRKQVILVSHASQLLESSQKMKYLLIERV